MQRSGKEVKMLNKKKTGKWDTMYSTYYWNMHLDPKFPGNSIPVMTGYSKMAGDNEAHDKDELLKRKIVTIYLNSYFNRFTHWEIFFRVGHIIDKKRDPKLLVLYPHNYFIPEDNHDIVEKRFGIFLKEFYERKLRHMSMEGLLEPGARKLKSQDDFLDVSKQHLPTIAHLHAYISRLYRNGHPPGAVESFFIKYKSLKGW